MSLTPGTTLGPYDIVALVGAGGMGEVYRARDTRLARDVAIKVLPASLAADADRLRRFQQEARAVAALNHPNVLSVHDVGTHQGAPYLVCEFLEGENLRERLNQGPLPQRKAVDLALQAARGLAAAHEKGIYHRDLKPENLFVLRSGRLKVLDFGLAKLRHPEDHAAAEGATLTAAQTYAGAVMGTAGYMSPEQVRGRPADHRSDIFSFGAVLYEMLCGQRAFQRDSALETMAAVLREDPPALAAAAPELPPALDRIVGRCLEKEPEQRFQSASDLAFALESLSSEAVSAAPRAVPPAAPSGPVAAAEPPPVAPPRPQLESWKEIASYLKRDVRTVKRWEKEEGLPVRRHLHKKLASVYAYEAELDEWQRNRQPREEQRAPGHAPRAALPWRWVAGGLAVVLAVAAYLALRPGDLAPAEETWVLIGRFDNRTGEDVFDGTVEYALERELSNSSSIRVAPRERVADALLLMRKPSDTVLDREMGREVSLRDGGIRALLTGRVEKLDSTYVLSADVIDPASGVVLAGLSEEARGQRETVAALRRLSDQVREALGERAASIRADTARLEKVTTPSLRALYLYSQAVALSLERQWDQAAGLLRQALAEDPDFASAHQLLAHCLENTVRLEEARRHFERAFQLSDTTAERERLFIRSGYFGRLLDDRDKAIEELETLVRLHPDHYFAVGNLRSYYRGMGKPREALRHSVRRAELRPANFTHQFQAAHELLVWGDARQAQPYLTRAQEILAAGPRETPLLHAWYKGWVAAYPFAEKWVSGNLQAARHEADLLSQVPQTPNEEFPVKWQAACGHVALGKNSSAQQILASIPAAPGEYLALAALAMGNEEEARRQLRRARPSHRAASLQVRMGMLEMAENALANPGMLERPYAPFLPVVWNSLVEGELALARGNPAKSVPLLQAAVKGLALDATPFFFLASEALARAWEQQGDPGKAVEVLEQASIYRRESVFWGPAPVFWMNNELMRARLYRRLGREADAKDIESELARLLTLADPDHPILRALKNTAGSR